VKKIPTELKQLAERRARVVGALSASVLSEQYADQIEILKLQLKNMEALFLASSKKKERLLEELAHIDKQFLEAYPAVNTGSIEPIAAWKGKYGKRGALRQFVLETLKSYAPAFVPTTKLSELAIIEFSLVFENSVARKKWNDNSFRGALKSLSMDGLVEQSEEPLSAKHKGLSHWRLKQESRPTLAALSRQSSSIVAAFH
jgi:hypothetical protein